MIVRVFFRFSEKRVRRSFKKELCKRSFLYGNYIIKQLEDIAKNRSEIIDVRGLGLMIGIEFATADERDIAIANCKNQGLLLAPAGAKAIRMTPPLIVTKIQIDKALAIFANALAY